MSSNILFEETQCMIKKSVHDFFKASTLLFVAALIFNLFYQKGNINKITLGLFSGFLFCLLITLLSNSKMVTQIRENGIFVRFPPFEPSFKRYLWKDIREIYIREFDAFTEYSQWGVRFGFSGVKYGTSGKAYILSGNKGIQLILSDGSKVLIGTQRSDEISSVLSDIQTKAS
jgi:hypothetical protein